MPPQALKALLRVRYITQSILYRIHFSGDFRLTFVGITRPPVAVLQEWHPKNPSLEELWQLVAEV